MARLRSYYPLQLSLVWLLGIILVPGCVGTMKEGSSPPFFLVDLVETASPASERAEGRPDVRTDGLSAPVTHDRVTRQAIATSVPSRLTFDLDIPEDPALVFAVAASPTGRPDLPAPVDFRVTVDVGMGEEVCFSQTLRRSQPGHWLEHELDLTAWAGRRASLRLETRSGAGDSSTRNSRVVAFWGNPVLVDRRARPSRPNIVLISIDCLRADHLGIYGYPRNTSPHLDGLARQAVVFETAMATSSYTHPTHMSMMTGLPPSLHGATRRRKLAASVDYLPEMLSKAGYRVDGYVSGAFLSQDFGFERGFHTYTYNQDPGAKQIVDEAVDLLRKSRGQSQFLFLHVFDPHWPYLPPRDMRDRFGERPPDISGLLNRVSQTHPPRTEEELAQMKLLYDGEIAAVDRELGRLFEEMRRMGLFDDSLIVVTADHGEAFMEHGFWEHAQTLNEEIVRIPLIVKWPRGPRGIRMAEPVSQADIFATVLDAAGIDAENPWSVCLPRHPDRSSLVDSRTLIAEITWEPLPTRGAVMQVALRNRKLKYIATFRAPTVAELYSAPTASEELYDLEADADEKDDIVSKPTSELARFRVQLQTYLDEARRIRVERQGEEVAIGESVLENLRALGYVQ